MDDGHCRASSSSGGATCSGAIEMAEPVFVV